jgi:hypothetical protein
VADEVDAQIDRFQAMYLDGGLEFVSLVNADSLACDACRAVGDQGYLPSGLPRLPVSGCTSLRGCRCRYEPSITVVE